MPKLSIAYWLEVAFSVIDIWLRYSLLAGAGVAAAVGQFMLAYILVVVAIGLFLRVWRAKRIKAQRVNN